MVGKICEVDKHIEKVKSENVKSYVACVSLMDIIKLFIFFN